MRRSPQLAPPRAIEGTWVSDAQAMPEPPVPNPTQLLPVTEGDGGAYPDDSGAYGNEGYIPDGYGPQAYDGAAYGGEGCCDGQCAEGCCGADGSCGPDGSCGYDGCDPTAGYGGPLGAHGCGKKRCYLDLWEDVHAHHRCWVAFDYLSFWAKGNKLPPLVTTSPLGTPPGQAGVLPVSATTQILFGDERVDTQQRNGGRLNIGYWLIDGEFLGVEGQYFTFEQQNTLFNASSNFDVDPNAIILARPFFDVNPADPGENALLIAYPGIANGSIDIRTTSNIQSANATLRRLIWIDFTMQRRLDLILGYRFFRLDDSVTIDDSRTTELGTLTIHDQFAAKNIFNGGEIGLKGYCYHGPFSLELIGKCAFGNNRETVFINGTHTPASPPPTGETGGLLALPTNIGSYKRDTFAVLPEANANLRLDIGCHWRMVLGYTFVYTNRVQRSGDAISTTINTSQIDGVLVPPAAPLFNFTDTTFWLHGWNAGAEFRW
jgi:hypothetical protein